MTASFPAFTGNCPRNVSKDAKYSIRARGGGDSVVTLTYEAANGERWYPSTRDHPDLVAAVNSVKLAQGQAPGGQFYINEYGQVLVPVADGTYYVATESYDAPLEFQFEGKTLSGLGVDLEGRPLEPGDLWVGPHPGIPYKLRAGGGDIYYASHPRPFVERKMWLSGPVGPDAARALASRIQQVKGWHGGRFYINEWWEMFAPVDGRGSLEYRYIGHLDESDRTSWFPKCS